MKRFKITSCALIIAMIVMWLPGAAIAATEVSYGSVTVTFSGNPDFGTEAELRRYAGRVIQEYYDTYCMHDSPLGQVYRDFDFKQLYKFSTLRNAFIKWGIQYTDMDMELINQFDGMYREYYFAAICKIDYDYNYGNSSYSFVRRDKESDADYKARVEPFYKMLLIDTFAKKAETDPAAIEALNPSKAGMYTLKMNDDGFYVMTLDEKGVMGNIESIADAQVNEAWMNFAINALQTAADTAIGYASLKGGGGYFDGQHSYAKSAISAMTKGIADTATLMTNTLFDNHIAKLKNNMLQIMQESIANNTLDDYNRIIAYLQNIYGGNDEYYVQYLNDNVFLEVVNDLLESIQTDKYNWSKNDAEQVLSEWYADGFSLEKVLDTDEIISLLVSELVEILVNTALSPFSVLEKESLGSDDTADKVAGVFINVIFTDFLKTAFSELVFKAGRDGVIKGQKQDNTDKARLAFAEAFAKHLVDIDKTLSQDKDITDKESRAVYAALLKAFVSKTDDITKLLKQMDEDKKDYDAGISTKTLSEETWSDIRELVCYFIDEMIKAMLGSYAKTLPVAIAVYTPLPLDVAEYSQVFTTISKLSKDIKSTAESLAKAVDAALSDARDDDQADYRALAMTTAYKASAPLEKGLKIDLHVLMAENDNKALTEIMALSSMSVSDIIKILDRIFMQMEYDIVGCRWFLDLMEMGEADKPWYKGDPDFYSYIMRQVKDTVWESRMTASVALNDLNAMTIIQKRWLSGWDESYRDLAS